MRTAHVLTLVALTATGPVACGGDDAPPTTSLVGESSAEEYPDVIGVVASLDAAGTWSFAVTMTSPYDSPERYADGWRVIGPDGTVYGVHTLTHDHAAEQPFTRRQSGVEIPDDVETVTIEGRDLVNGYGGQAMTVPLQR